MEWLRHKVISTSIQQKLDFQKKNKTEIFFKQLAVLNIQICINRYLMSRRFGRSPYSNIFSFWLIGYNLFAWSVSEKLTAGKIHAWDKTSEYWVFELLEYPIHWLVDLGPRNRGFYTGLIELPKIHRILKKDAWTLVIRRDSTHSKITKTAMFNRRPMGSPILNIFESNLLQWFHD